MDFSANNTALWNGVIQFGIIAGIILLANILRRKLPFIKKSLMPTAVLGGFLLLLLRSLNILPIDTDILEMVTYHGIALGFIAMALRRPEKGSRADGGTAVKSGALIVSTYLMQGILGLLITIGLAYTFMPDLFKAAGILLPMGYGQGPGQANNVGSAYEALGFTGGRSFGLSIAAAGYLCACLFGVAYLNILNRKKRLARVEAGGEISGSVTVDAFQDKGEIPISESVDKLSVQAALVIIVYFLTFLISYGIDALLSATAPGLAGTVSPLLWGFNFIVGSVVAMLCRSLFTGLRKMKIMTRQYQNNYLLSRIAGLAFDLMIVAGIGSINIEDLSGLWVPFMIMAIAGGVVTFIYLFWICKKIYPEYFYEGFLSMYGMLTGTISSGVLLLREIDPQFETPAANNLITGSSVAILFGAPMLLLISLAPESTTMLFVTLGLLTVYFIVLLVFMIRFKGFKKKKSKA